MNKQKFLICIFLSLLGTGGCYILMKYYANIIISGTTLEPSQLETAIDFYYVGLIGTCLLALLTLCLCIIGIIHYHKEVKKFGNEYYRRK